MKNQKIYISNNLQGIKSNQMALLIKASGGEVVEEKDLKAATLCILDKDKDGK